MSDEGSDDVESGSLKKCGTEISEDESHEFTVYSENAKTAKKVTEYYQKQNEMLECFKKDSEQIEAFNRMKTRKRALKFSESEQKDQKRMRKSDEILILKDEDLRKFHGSKESLMNRHEQNLENERKTSVAATRLANITLAVNFTLMCAKIVASVMSGSMSIISSMVDSVVDLTSGLVLSVSAHMIEKRDPYEYPRGRTRLEPLSLILISVIMGMASVQLIIQSVKRIVAAATGEEKAELEVDYASIAIMLTTIAVKLCLFVICMRYKSNPSIKVLSMDHRNDCLSNSVALACAWIASTWKNYYYLDPIGAILVSIYILYTWMRTGLTHILMLSGRSAAPEFINRIIKVCIDHDSRITHIDTVYVYHYGTKFLVEVHIVLNKEMVLKIAHDISESLQINIESLPEVERAFVHTDYDFDHHPRDEHKTV